MELDGCLWYLSAYIAVRRNLLSGGIEGFEMSCCNCCS